MMRLFIASILTLVLLLPRMSYTQSSALFGGGELSALMGVGDYYGVIKYTEKEIEKYEKAKKGTDYTLGQNVLPYHYIALSSYYQLLGLPNQALMLLKRNEGSILKSNIGEDAKLAVEFIYLIALVELYEDLGQDDEFLITLKKIKETADTHPDHYSTKFTMLQYYTHLGRYHFERNRYSEAVLPLSEASRLRTELMAKNFSSTRTLEDFYTANNSLIISLYKGGKIDEIKTLSNSVSDLAIFYQLKGDFEESLKYYSKFYDKYSKLDSFFKMTMGESIHHFYYGMLCLMGNPDALEIITGRSAQEETILKTRFISFSEKEKKDFLKKYTAHLNLYYSALLYLHDKGERHSIELLEKSLQTKGLIMDITKQQKTLMREAMTDRVLSQRYEQALKLRNKIAALSQAGNVSDSLTINSAKLSEMERKINESLSGKISILPTISWTEIKHRLAPNESFVNITRIERDNFKFDEKVVQYYAFIIKHDSDQPQMVKLGEGKDFESRLFNLYQNSIRNQLEDTKSYDNFWRPLAVNLKEINKVFLSTDGIYNLISLPTLYNTETKKYLIEDIEVVRVGTGRDFISNGEVTKTNPSAISLVGNPDFMMKRSGNDNLRSESVSSNYILGSVTNLDRAGLSPLPGTQKEIELIGEQAKSSGISVSLYSGSNATEKNVKRIRNPSVLHLATHGQFDQYVKEDSYLQSKLILAGASNEESMTLTDYEKFDDGLLTAFEVIQMNLDKTDLIVLSACETGLGEVQNGEGVWGLQRAFQLAGAKSVMGSLWKISDEATVTYMDAFYKSYLSGTSIPKSYQAAMKITKTKYPHPYYWGAFILNGN